MPKYTACRLRVTPESGSDEEELMKKRAFLFLLVAAVVLVSCASPFSTPAQAVPTESRGSVEQPTFTSVPPLPTAAVEPTVPPTATPYTPFEVSMMVDHANVRSNPGYLFDVVMNVSQGTKFSVLGKAPGGEWFLVQNTSGAQGWVFGQLLESEHDLQAVPVIMPANVQVLEGRIMNAEGRPVSGVQFAFVQNANGQELRNDGNSDENGIFLVFMPLEIGGEWMVSYTAISCTSNTMDQDCNCLNNICGNVDPSFQSITLPQKEPVLFTWVYAQ